MTSYGLSHFKQMVRVWKIKSLLFCLRDDPLIVGRRQNHVIFILIKTMSHDLLVQVAYLSTLDISEIINIFTSEDMENTPLESRM